MIHRGRCHCGAVAYEVEGEPKVAVACNCSICSRKGALLWAVPRGDLRLTTPEENAARYSFNRGAIIHRFCTTCGIHPYAEDAGDGAGRTAYINLRCLETVDANAIEVMEFDGRNA